MNTRERNIRIAIRGFENYLRAKKRIERKRKIKAIYQKQLHQLNLKYKQQGQHNRKISKSPFSYRKGKPLPKYPINIKYFSTFPNLFAKSKLPKNDNGYFYIPETFSLIDNYEESFVFLRRLYSVLHKGKTADIILDYEKCNRIDVDASICMDIILAEFIQHLTKCTTLGHKGMMPHKIQPVNYQKDQIMKILFSTGVYRNLKGWTINYPDIEALPVLINHQNFSDKWNKSEVHLTQIVEYIKKCLNRLGRELSSDAETEFYKVVGEIMSNAEEHSTMPHRYAIGFFQESNEGEDNHHGIFNFSIFNFGNTIYQSFKSADCLNKKAIEQMTELSEDYTKRGWFSKAEFEEETLWTLYALQEGVTSKEKKRGNGSIQYIENFFKLKGDQNYDSISKLVLMSGNTRITFDGSYNIVEKPKKGEKRNFKMITFNKSGEISEKPDKKYVNFAPNFFPGTIISARILIKFDNTNKTTDGNDL